MNSLFANLFVAVQQRIKTQVSAIKHIDQDLSQLEAYDPNGGKPAVTWPCALIDLDNFTFTNLGDEVQEATGNVIIRLGFPPYSPTSSIVPATYRDKALQYYEYEYEVYKALEGWCPGDEYQYLNRISAVTEKREDTIRVRVITFATGFTDDSAQKPVIRISRPDLDVQGEMEGNI